MKVVNETRTWVVVEFAEITPDIRVRIHESGRVEIPEISALLSWEDAYLLSQAIAKASQIAKEEKGK